MKWTHSFVNVQIKNQCCIHVYTRNVPFGSFEASWICFHTNSGYTQGKIIHIVANDIFAILCNMIAYFVTS